MKYAFLILCISLVEFCFSQNREDFRSNQQDTFYGAVLQDPYRMLEDTGNAKVKTWMKSEAAKTDKFYA